MLSACLLFNSDDPSSNLTDGLYEKNKKEVGIGPLKKVKVLFDPI